ncbi:MAG: gamma carbonic anhydrase family protein [Steroidobacteraceae bacterium]
MIYTLGERRLKLLGTHYYIAPSADLIGAVELGEHASVWFHAVLRADIAPIIIGAGSNIQDSSIIHVNDDEPTRIGTDVSVGHGVTLHACTVADECLIGNGAIVLDGAKIGRGSIVAARALVPPGKVIPPESVVMGSPGKVVRQASADDRARIRYAAQSYRARIPLYRRQLAVDPDLNQ